MRKWLQSCYFLVLLSIASLPLHAADDTNAIKYFEAFLNNCRTNEIRCLWFLQDQPKIGMVMTFNLPMSTVYTAREVYNWATQASDNRKLTQPQVISLQEIMEKMPSSESTVRFAEAISVAIRRNGNVEIYHYHRSHPPSVIQRLYDIGGGYFYGGNSH
jgi:hypothetical protein